MFVKIKGDPYKDTPNSSAKEGLAAYTKEQKQFAKRQADSHLGTAASHVTKANDILYEAGLIKGKLIR